MTDNPIQADDPETGIEADGVSERRRVEVAAEQEHDTSSQPTQTLSEADKYVLDLKKQTALEAEKEKLSNAVKNLQERDELKAVHPKILVGQLHEKAASDEAFKQHFYDQDKNPAAWKGALDNLAGEVAEFVKPNDKAAEDLAAANASVRGDSNEAPKKTEDSTTNAEVARMTDREYQNRLESLPGYTD